MNKLIFALLMLAAPFALADCTVDTLFIEPARVTPSTTYAELVVRGSCSQSNIPFGPVVRFDDSQTIIIEFQRQEVALLVPAKWGERVRLPMLDAGTYNIKLVTSALGTEMLGQTTLTVTRPSIIVTPSFGGEGTEVTVDISHMPACQGVCPPMEILFGNTKASKVDFGPRGEIIATVPRGSGLVDVRARQGSVSVTSENAFRYGTAFESDMERVLFPVNFAARGAFGSDWTTDISVRNDGPVTIETRPTFWSDPGSPVLPIPMPIPPRAKGDFPVQQRDGGQFLYVPRGLEKYLSYASHVVDRSRSDLDLGTEVRVVRERDAAPVVKLLEVPVDARYRAKLRVYNLDENETVSVLLRDRLSGRVVQRDVQLTGYETCANGPCFSERPGFGVLDLDTIPELRTMQDGVDITIEAPTRDARLWAFVTVTNNETHHVTVYTPQHRTRAQ
ncbi:MAG TPA: hypothetical protein VF911_20900 [Thermoanaerobaculia bacterium]|jgi:hypothetical protein